ncbi:hypothetical protein K431DRAFT_97966 [Polychaeton citri CBS 116435]|uniref:Uncharacterized protein n=1 Tax=Polychaeton citri CBS 116435 TaxID=1314669 RepID=A0A9P4UTW8_9PEZI|nr:hypothetical protein K431DRAFT_97966 [Polychaeton citri CBS 116435]
MARLNCPTFSTTLAHRSSRFAILHLHPTRYLGDDDPHGSTAQLGPSSITGHHQPARLPALETRYNRFETLSLKCSSMPAASLQSSAWHPIHAQSFPRFKLNLLGGGGGGFFRFAMSTDAHGQAFALLEHEVHCQVMTQRSRGSPPMCCSLLALR